MIEINMNPILNVNGGLKFRVLFHININILHFHSNLNKQTTTKKRGWDRERERERKKEIKLLYWHTAFL